MVWDDRQLAGRSWPIGCVALEVTQRCNLDCTLCYLSEHADVVRDIPIDEVFRRIDMIHRRYGPHTNIQVTGGDPTLRRRDELVCFSMGHSLESICWFGARYPQSKRHPSGHPAVGGRRCHRRHP